MSETEKIWGLTQSLKVPLKKDTETNTKFSKLFKDIAANQYTTQESLHLVNMITGGSLAQLLTQPSWEDRITKAGLGMMYSISDSVDDSILLLFQYNPQTLNERFSVSYAYRQSFSGEPTISEFKSVEPQKVYVEFYLDAYSDYAGLDEYFRTLLSGSVQSAMLLTDSGSRGMSELAWAAQTARNNALYEREGLNKDSRTLKPALDNLKRFTKNTVYSIDNLLLDSDLKLVETTTYLGDPPLCVLNWGTYQDFKCVVKDMSFEHLLFNPKTLDPIRTKVTLELEEFYNPYLEAAKKAFDGKIEVNI